MLKWYAQIFGISDLDEEDINDICHYQPEGLHPDLPYGPNFGCPLGYFPFNNEGNEWSQGSFYWWMSLGFGIDEDEADVYAALEMYCECHVGIDDGCAAKVTRLGDNLIFHDEKNAAKEWVDYCKFAGIWNGDFSIDDEIVLTEDVEDCGCYFVGDRWTDILAAHLSGVSSVLLSNPLANEAGSQGSKPGWLEPRFTIDSVLDLLAIVS